VFKGLNLNKSRQNHFFLSEKKPLPSPQQRNATLIVGMLNFLPKKHSLKKLVTCIQIRNCIRNAAYLSGIFIRVCCVCL